MGARPLTRALAALVAAATISAAVHGYSTYARWASNTATFYVNPANADVTCAEAAAALAG